MAQDADTGKLDAGNWAPVREERDDYALPVKGELPRELSGTLFRMFNSVAHVDNTTGRRRHYELPGGDATSEPVFVPRSVDAAEGDGWLLATVWRAAENRSDLVMLDATEVERGPIATVRLATHVPFGLHGNWVSATA